MDWVLEVRGKLEKEVSGQVVNLLNLEVDLLFFDTTSTYFETDGEDEPFWRHKRGRPVADREGQPTGSNRDETRDKDGGKLAAFLAFGKSKDHRDDLPQIVIGMAVTRDGILVRVWCWPGDTGGSKLIRQVKDEMRDWTLARIVWVADQGFSSTDNRRLRGLSTLGSGLARFGPDRSLLPGLPGDYPDRTCTGRRRRASDQIMTWTITS